MAIKLKIHYTNDAGDGAKMTFRGNPKKALEVIDMLREHIASHSPIQAFLNDVDKLEIERIKGGE